MSPEQVLAEADRCVKCGYCLPHCPSYALSADEGESPRGRIALIQALIQGTVDTPRLHQHLDSCLVCRSCEAVCPSEVRYGQLISAVRAIQSGNKTPGAMHRLGLTLLSSAPYRPTLASLAGAYQRLGIASLVNRLGGAVTHRLHGLMPADIRTETWKQVYPTTTATIGRVGLFTGCIGRITDRPALLAGIRILNRLGYEVIVPSNQRCCGAMHRHAGDGREAESLARQNQDAFAGHQLDAVLGVASGCSSRLVEYGGEDAPLAAPVMDISDFLFHAPNIDQLKFLPLHKRVAIHTPCSMKTLQNGRSAPHQLLKLIPDTDLLELPENGLCCGAAGLYLLTNPDAADTLRKDKTDGLQQSQAEILITSNTGCALHMAAGIREAGMEVEVLHPVELLSRQLRD